MPDPAMPRMVLVGEVGTAAWTLHGLLRAGHPPVAILTTDVRRVQAASAMSPSYYADLVGLGAEHGIETRVIDRLDDEGAALRDLRPDYIWIMGWPYIVREPVLSIAPCIGMHPTRLPERRGGAPLNWAILDGERAGAVSLIRLRPGLDDGEVLAQQGFAIGCDEYVGDVLERVWQVTAALVERSARALAEGSATWEPQDHSRATYTRRRGPEDGRVAWNDSATRIRNLVRATSTPFPGAFTTLHGRRLRIWRASIPRGFRAPLRAAPGTLLDALDDGVLVSTRDNALLVEMAQLDGEEPLTGAALGDALRAHRGEVLA